MDWVHLDQDRDRWRTLANELSDPINEGKFVEELSD
jgi:hypothetical protein